MTKPCYAYLMNFLLSAICTGILIMAQNAAAQAPQPARLSSDQVQMLQQLEAIIHEQQSKDKVLTKEEKIKLLERQAGLIEKNDDHLMEQKLQQIFQAYNERIENDIKDGEAIIRKEKQAQLKTPN